MRLALKPTFTYKDLFSTYLKPQWRRTLLMALLILAGIGLQLANPQILRYFIDSATSGGGMQSLLAAGVLYIGISLVSQAVSVASTYVSENVAWMATNRLRADLVRHCLSLDMAFHKERTAGELIERIDGDVNALSTFFAQSFVQLLGNGLLIIGILILLFRADWRIGGAMFLFVVIALVIVLSLRNYATPHWVAAMQNSAELSGFFSEQLAGTQDVRANGATGYVMQRFHHMLRTFYPVTRRAGLASYTLWSITMLLFGAGNALILILGAYLVSIKAISLGTAYVAFYYLNLLTEPLEQVRDQMQQLQQSAAGIERIRQLFQLQPTILDGDGPMLPPGALSVEMTDVTFEYTPGEPILRDLNLHVRAGHVLGVVGRTGSGKSTLARLLLRLYDPQKGTLALSGMPLQRVPMSDLRRRVGMVTQDVQLFNASVRDNLTFFDRSIGDQRILEVLEEVGLLLWYQTLEQGLDTELGTDGEGLSAGEAQLLALSRVFLADPGLVILDEASSRLDPATEQLIERAISKLLYGRTSIIIAHRLATLRRADEILVLAAGRVIEHGSRSELITDPHSHFFHLLQTGLENEQGTSLENAEENAENTLETTIESTEQFVTDTL